MKFFGQLICASSAAIVLPAAAAAQDVGQPPALSFNAALARIDKASPGLSGEDHEVRAAEALAAATRTLHRPVISTSASVIEYQKTLTVDLTGPKNDAIGATTDFLQELPGQFPAGFQEIIAQVTQRVGSALPGLFAAIPDSLQYQTRDTVFRPAVTAVMPIYTGGAIPAVQNGAEAARHRACQAGRGPRPFARVAGTRLFRPTGCCATHPVDPRNLGKLRPSPVGRAEARAERRHSPCPRVAGPGGARRGAARA